MAWKSAIFIIVLLFGPIRMKEASSIDQVHGWSSSKQYSSRPGQNQSNNGLFGQKSNSQGFHTQSNGGNRTTTGSSGGDKKPSSSSTVEFDPVNQSGNRRVHSKTSNFNEVFQELQKYGPKTVGPQDIRAFDNDVLTLTDRANDHLLSKHGQDFGINDPLPKNSNQKPTKYNKQQERTRLNKKNRKQFRENVKKFLSEKETGRMLVFDNISIRGRRGKAYVCLERRLIVAGVKVENKIVINKAQPLAPNQLDSLIVNKRLD